MSHGFYYQKSFIGLLVACILILISLYGFNFYPKQHKIFYKQPPFRSSHGNNTINRRILPKAIIIGVRKGGTRALLRGLSLHPDIYTATKEIHFFDRDQNYGKGLEWYRSKMPEVPYKTGQIVMEKSPSYFVTPGVPERIYKMSKNVKLLVVVRNPTKRAISDYTQLKSKNAKLPSFERYITSNNEESELDVNNRCIQCGLYSKHLKRWLLYFPLSQIHFVSGEKLISQPVKELKKVEKFLNLKSLIGEKDFVFNNTKGFPCFRKQHSNTNFSCLGATKGRVHPRVRQDILDALKKFYEPYNKVLYRMVKQDFNWDDN